MTQDLYTPRDDWSQFYEIVIGGLLNQKSCIRALTVTCTWIGSPGILNSADYVQLWISWDNNNIQLGKGSRADGIAVVSHSQNIPYDVNYLAVMTHYSSLWRFYEGGLFNLVKILKIINLFLFEYKYIKKFQSSRKKEIHIFHPSDNN